MDYKETYLYHHPKGFEVWLTCYLKYNHATNDHRFAPHVVQDGEKRPICNGAGPAGYGAVVPDTIWGLRISEAAHGHDWHYQFGTTLEDKEQADRTFKDNMDRIIRAAFVRDIKKANLCKGRFKRAVLTRKANFLYHRRIFRADKIYFNAVRIAGKSAFWDKGACDFTLEQLP